MKVLEKCEGWNLEVKCTGFGNGGGGCNSRLLIEPNDVYMTFSTDYLGDTDSYYTFCCPVCNAETDINAKKIPGRIRDLASNHSKTRKLRR